MRRLSAPALCLGLLALGGCGRWRAGREAEAAVRAYNEAIIVAYRTNDPRGLRTVAGAQEVRRLVALIDLKRGAGLALESRLEELELLGAASSATAATVRTRERWRYWDRALRPGLPAGQVFVAEMWMTWDLVRESGRLKVAGGRTERSLFLEPEGFRPAGGSGSRELRPESPPAAGIP